MKKKFEKFVRFTRDMDVMDFYTVSTAADALRIDRERIQSALLTGDKVSNWKVRYIEKEIKEI
jgi:hypothetical protein